MNDAKHPMPPEPQGTRQQFGEEPQHAREASQTQRVFLANLRHELRTPINAILGYSELLGEDAADHGQTNLLADLQKVHAAGTTLLTLVNDLLDPAAIEAGKVDLGVDSFGAKLRHDLRTPINTIIGYSELLIEDATDQGQHDVISDLQKIHVAATRFLRLIDDVVNVSRLAAGEIDPGHPTMDTSVIHEDVANTIHFLEDATRTAHLHHGLVLIVDDNATNRDMLARRLKREGHTSVAAEQGRQALEIVTTQPFDLVLLDIMMPELNGYQVLQQLKADPALRDIPVIMISALDELDSVVRCIELGAADYLLKPFNPVLLRARIGACLEQKRLRDQEVEYLRNVASVTTAAAAVEAGAFEPASLAEVALRRDALGQLGRVFQRMAREVYAREQNLRQQVQELRIEIDEVKKAQQVAEITETDYFQQLQEKARKLRSNSPK